MRRNAGFTLVELLVVVAIIGILFSIALPAYSHYRVISLRGAAKAVLMELAARQDVHLAQRGAYVADADDLGTILGVTIPTGVYEHYKVTIEIPVGGLVPDTDGFEMPAYTIIATPRLGTPQADDGVLTVNQFGLRTPVEKW